MKGLLTFIITDHVGNALTLKIARDITRPRYAALVIPSFHYTSGTTTAATTSQTTQKVPKSDFH